LILDLLNTFYDDHVPTYEAYRLLKSCLGQIQRLLLSGPVVVTLAPPLAEERDFLLEQVCRQADEVSSKKCPPPIHPTALFLMIWVPCHHHPTSEKRACFSLSANLRRSDQQCSMVFLPQRRHIAAIGRKNRCCHSSQPACHVAEQSKIAVLQRKSKS
jgi:hypothetical protein